MESVDLKLFVKQTLLEIIEGVAEAQKVAPAGTIVPSDIARNFTAVEHKVSHLQPVSFEVQVVAENSSAKGAKISVIGGLLGGEGQGEKKNSAMAHSTLRFTVPIHLPLGGKSRT